MKYRILHSTPLEFYDTNADLVGSITANGTNLKISSVNGIIELGNTATDIQVGTIGTSVNWSFLGGGVIGAAGTGTISLGQSGDTVNMNVAGVTYNWPAKLLQYNQITGVNNKIDINTSVPGSVILTLPNRPIVGQLSLTDNIEANSGTSGTLQVAGGASVTGNLYAGNVVSLGTATATRFISTQTTGTAPFTVASTTLVTNLNADLLDGLNSASTNTVSTIVARDASGNFATNIINPTQILQGTNTFIRDYASGYSTTVTANTLYEIGRITFTGSSQNIAIVGEIRGGSGASVGVTRFILDLRSDTLPAKSFTLFEEEITVLGRLIRVKVYQDTASGLVVIGYSANASLQNIGWSLKVQERGNYNYLQQTTTLTPLVITGLTEVALTSTSRTISSNFETSGTATATRFISTVTTGTAPFTVSSNTSVANLNADLLDGLEGTSYANSTFAQAGFDKANAATTSAQNAYNLSNTSSQLAYSNVLVNGVLISADTKQTTLTLTSGNGVTLLANSIADSINVQLTSTGVTAGTYGSSNTIPVITVDAQGRISFANAVSSSSGSSGSLGYPNSSVNTIYGALSSKDLRTGPDNVTAETPFEPAVDAFGVLVTTVYDCMDPVGSYTTFDLNT